MYRILNAESSGYSPKAKAILESVGKVDEIPLEQANLAVYDVVIVRLGYQVDASTIERASSLKAIATATTGLDHIDLQAAERKGIQILSLKGEYDFLNSIHATAELTWSLMLLGLRRLPQAVIHAKTESWQRDLFRGQELYGKKLGIVGYGRLGQKVAKYGIAFGMEVLANDLEERKIPQQIAHLSLKELASTVDILSLHVPLNKETEKLIDEDIFDAMPSHAWLINTSRGAVVDEYALLTALKEEKIAGAALDVITQEHVVQAGGTHPLISYAQSHDNLILTPHIGGATFESTAATEIFIAKKIAKLLF